MKVSTVKNTKFSILGWKVDAPWVRVFAYQESLEWNTFSGTSERDFKFFISTNYNYDKRIWKSWLFKITQNDWRSTDTNEYRFPQLGTGSWKYKKILINRFSDDRIFFYRDTYMNGKNFSNFEKSDNTGDSKWRKRFDDDGFKTDLFSSNNSEFLKIRPGYFICRNKSETYFVQTEVRDEMRLHWFWWLWDDRDCFFTLKK